MFSSNKQLTTFLRTYKLEIILATCWTLVQASLFYHYGIVTEFEATKYIAEADNIIAKGSVTTPNFWLYSTQIFLITAAKKLNTGYLSVAMVQWLFSGIATWYFYKFSVRIGNKLTGFIAALILVFTIPLQTFNFFLQTESLFCSFTILFSCYLLSLEKLTFRYFTLIILFLLLICFTRPTGLLWVPCTFIYLFFRFFRSFSTVFKIAITAATAIGFLFFLNTALGSGGELDFMLPFRDERIICGVPTLSHFVDIKTSDNPNSIFGILYYITHNFGQFSRLAWLRSKAFFGLLRSYYSTGHNIYLALFFYPLYLLSLLSLPKWIQQNKYLFLYCSSLIFLTWITVILTCDEWHNRFFLTVVPYIYILAIPFIKQLTDKPGNNASKKSVRT